MIQFIQDFIQSVSEKMATNEYGTTDLFKMMMDFYAEQDADFANSYGDKIGGSTLQPILRRNGLTMDKLNFFDKKDKDYRFLMRLVAKEPFYETLIKSNQGKLSLYNFSTEEQRKAMLLNLRFGIDISGLSKDEFIQWKDSISLFYHALSSVKEYYDECKAMHHCVYQCRYYLKKDVVIFSIRDADNQRLDTLEYNAKSKEIVQCRAVCNQVPARYDDIVKVFNTNIWRVGKTKRKKQQLLNVA